MCAPDANNRNLSRRFSRMRTGGTLPSGAVRGTQPTGWPNPRTSGMRSVFTMVADPLDLDFEGYSPMGGDTVIRYGSATGYLNPAPDTLRGLMLLAG